MTTQKRFEATWLHRQAGLVIQFEYQDKGETISVDYTTVLGQVPDSEIWIVRIDGQATDSVAAGEYWWPVVEYLAVSLLPDGMPTSRHATDEEIALFEDEEDEPTLVPCPYCVGMHYVGQKCPLQP